MSSCDPQIAGIPKSAISIEIPRCCNPLLSRNTKLNSFIWFSMKNFLLVKACFCEKGVALGLASQPYSPSVLKTAINIDISRFSFSSATTGLNFSVKNSIEICTPVEKTSIEKPLMLIHVTRS